VNAWHILTSEYPPDIGGVSDYTRQVAEGLARTGDEVHVWCPREADRHNASGVRIHPELGGIRLADLRRLDRLLKPFPAPRRLLVQWVPHGFGYHSMNIWFCLWLAKRAWSGDSVDLMVHEPYLEFGRGPIRHALMACVHRLMTMVLLGAAHRVWMAIPAWEERLRPYAFGRPIPMDWLPVPGCVAPAAPAPTAAIRQKYAADEQPLIGHFGSFGSSVTVLLEERLPAIMDGHFTPSLLLLGPGSETFRAALIERHPSWLRRVHAAGYVPSEELGAHIAACDVFVQPYPDGITSRRTSAMACLSQGRPLVTTHGHLTEPLWARTGAVALADVTDAAGFVSGVTRLLADRDERQRVGARGRSLYGEQFALSHVVTALRAA
jgi:glycosyltransferase involved in cell wall biosynthesis